MPRKPYRCKRNKMSLARRKMIREKLAKEKLLNSCPGTTKEVETDNAEKLWDQLIQKPSSEDIQYDENEEANQRNSSDSSDSDFLPELVIEVHEEIPETIVTGRRIVNIDHVLRQLETVATHRLTCTMGKFKLQKEIVNGFYSTWVYYCDNCEKEFCVTSEPEEKKEELNEALVWGALSIGIGHFQAEELFGVMDVPLMSFRKFKRHEKKIGESWNDKLGEKMLENAEEEKRIAVQKGNLWNGLPFITVIGDASWAKRSYGHGLNSSAGVGVIIGAETKKLLFVGVRNKYCYVCALNKSKQKEIAHECFINYKGPSTGMESEVIVEGFRRSEQDYGLVYKCYIGDGDSNVFAKIQERCQYGRYVQKIECANHMVRNLSAKLHKLSSDSRYPLFSRKSLSSVTTEETISRLERLVKGIRTAIKHCPDRSDESVKLLRQDIFNSVNHVFGQHEKCRDYFCKRKERAEVNLANQLDKEFMDKIREFIQPLCDKAGSLAWNETTNCAERFMGIIAKFCGGKRIDFTKRGTYRRRCFGAGLAHFGGPKWHLSPWKKMQSRSPGAYFKKVMERREVVHSKRKLRFSENAVPQSRKRKRFATYDQEYGPDATVPDIEEEEMIRKKEEFLEIIRQEGLERDALERRTIGQHSSIEWKEKRINRLTASNFGNVIKRRLYTSCHCLVKTLLFPKELNTKAIRFGRGNENVAVGMYETQTGRKVDKCGLFIDRDNPFLGASPDGLIGDRGLIEVKCIKIEQTLLEFVTDNKKTWLHVDIHKQLKLKRNHSYFFQIQGQLNIAKRDWCDLVVYTGKEIFIENIERDEALWNNIMVPKLIKFYMNCMLPEIIDSRINRGLKARDPEYVIEAQGERQKNN